MGSEFSFVYQVITRSLQKEQKNKVINISLKNAQEQKRALRNHYVKLNIGLDKI